jgi:FPC/CPF motif-containing protein YcgG
VLDPIPATHWQKRLIRGNRHWDGPIPGWLAEAWQAFERNVSDTAYPCFFGTQALRANAIHYSFVDGGDAAHLPETLHHFLHACRDHPLANFAVFFEPVPGLDHEDAGQRFWDVLALLHAHDPDPADDPAAEDPDNPLWEFAFSGVQMFVVGASPTYRNRASRNLGAATMMLFQPRDVFDIGNLGKDSGDQARRLIRKRLLAWDGMPHHPALGTYGDSENREWKQYFLPDDNEATVGRCPLHRRLPEGAGS